MKDKAVTCVQCGDQFVITCHELEKLTARGFGFPKRCPDCRKRRSKNAHEVHDEWEDSRKRKQPRKERNIYDKDD